MRTEILNYINSIALGNFLVTDELPYEENGNALYLKNLKKIYVDDTESIVEPVFSTLNGVNISNETLISRIYFANDAKTSPPDYEDLLADLRAAANITTVEGVKSRSVDVVTTFEGDVQVTEIEIRFIRIST